MNDCLQLNVKNKKIAVQLVFTKLNTRNLFVIPLNCSQQLDVSGGFL